MAAFLAKQVIGQQFTSSLSSMKGERKHFKKNKKLYKQSLAFKSIHKLDQIDVSKAITASLALIVSSLADITSHGMGNNNDDDDTMSTEEKNKLEEEKKRRERLAAFKEAEEARKEEHRKWEEEREILRDGIRQKYNISKQPSKNGKEEELRSNSQHAAMIAQHIAAMSPAVARNKYGSSRGANSIDDTDITCAAMQVKDKMQSLITNFKQD